MKKLPLLALSIISAISSAGAQTTVSTDPVGFVSVTVPAASDAVLAVPLNRAAVFQGMIQSISGSTITLKGTPGFAPSQFVFASGTQNNTYAVQIATGTKEGMIAKVTANDAVSITVELDSSDDLSSIIADSADGTDGNGDQITIMPYWTPSTVLGANPASGTQLLFFPSNVAGVNLGASSLYVYNGTEWRLSGLSSNHVPLPFARGFILRNNAASSQTFSLVGSVPMAKHWSKIFTLAGSAATNQAQDNWVGFVSPVPEALGSVSLGFTPGDQLLVFDNSTTGKNKAASSIIVWNGTDWKRSGETVTNTFMLQPGFGYVYRKKGTGSAVNLTWSDLQGYLQ